MKILIAGDFCPMDRVAKLIEKEDYGSVFGEVKEYTQQADFSIVNLEAPVVETDAKPIEKCGPNLKCTSKAIKALKYAGFDMATLANNHFYDYGDDGVKQTLDACQKEGIDVVGGGMNITDAAKIFYKEIKGVKVAIVNCCEHEFSIATENSGGSNPLNPIQQYYAINEAKQNADKVILIVHGGHELYQLPSPRMKETYRFFVDAGADAVINHHQHCYSGYEVYKDKPIFYGLGNFCFDRATKRDSVWNKGYMVMLHFTNEIISFENIPYIQGNDKAGIYLLKDMKKFKLEIFNLNSIIANDQQLKEKHIKWMDRTSEKYIIALEPYKGKLFTCLYSHNLVPKFINRNKAIVMLAYLRCEAHMERTLNALNKIKCQK